MSFFDTVADAPVDDAPADCMPVPSSPALDAAPVADKKRRVRPTLEDEPEKVLEGEVDEDKKELFGEDFEGEAVVVVDEALAKRPRAPLDTRESPSSIL